MYSLKIFTDCDTSSAIEEVGVLGVLWWNFKRESMRKLTVAYHTILKLLLGFSKYDSNSYVCSVFNIKNCEAVMRNFIFKFIVRVENSSNKLLQSVLKSSLGHTSRIRAHWNKSLYTIFQ